MKRASIIVLAGTCMSPQIYDLIAAKCPFDIVPFSWMDSSGPWDVESLGRSVRALARQSSHPVFLAGHSTGGAIAIAAAVSEPSLFQGMILSGTGAHMRNHRDVRAIIGQVDTDWCPEFAARIVERSFHEPPVGRELEIMREYAQSARREVVLEVLSSQADLDFTANLRNFESPVIVAHGINDRARPLGDAELLASGFPRGELISLQTGHTPMWEDPESYSDALRLLSDRCQDRRSLSA